MKEGDRMVELPGRLGDPALDIGTDPRADPRLVEALRMFGLHQRGEPAPVSASSSHEDCLAFFAEMERQYAMMSDMFHEGLTPLAVEREQQFIAGPDGNEIQVFIHRPRNQSGTLPCILHFHGGGMVFLKAANVNYARWRDELAVRGAIVIGVEFRNGAGELGNHPFPAGLNDCATALRWAYQNRPKLKISNIITSGESGGGNLSIAVAIKAKSEGWIEEISGVFAMCPYISGQYANPPGDLPSMIENDGYTVQLSMMGALAKTYDPQSANLTNPKAWPYASSEADLRGLPPHFISVNELDPLRDEGIGFHRRLLKAEVSSVCHTILGTCHGGDCISPNVIPDVYQATLSNIIGFARACDQ